MSTILLVLLCIVGVAVLAAVSLLLVIRFKPEWATPFTGFLLKRKKVRESVTGRISRELAENPEAFEEMMQEQVGREGARQLQKTMKGKSEAQIQEQMETVLAKQQRGEPVTIADLQGKTRTPDHTRQKNKKKQAARQKRKNAKKQKRKR